MTDNRDCGTILSVGKNNGTENKEMKVNDKIYNRRTDAIYEITEIANVEVELLIIKSEMPEYRGQYFAVDKVELADRIKTGEWDLLN